MKGHARSRRLCLEALEDRTLPSGLQAIAVTELTAPNPGPMQVAVDFNEALQPTPAQTASNYKIFSQSGTGLPIQSAVYSDNGTQHRVVLTVAATAQVWPNVYHVSIDAPNLTATNGDQGAPKIDRLWVDVTSTNSLEPITVQADGSFGASGSGEFLGYPPPQQVLAGSFTGGPYPDLVVLTASEIDEPPPQILLLRSTGNGTYAAPVPISVQGSSPVQPASSNPTAVFQQIGSIAAVDWNHDGHTDLVVSTRSSDLSSINYYILLNDGRGDFTDAPETPIVVAENAPDTPFAVYDLNGDGHYEIIHPGTSDFNGNLTNLEIIGKDPYFGYTPQLELPWTGAGTPSDFTFADLNGDGKPDIITSNGGYYLDNPGVTVYLSTPTGYAAGNDVINPLGSPQATDGAFTGAGQKDIAVVYDDYRNSEDTQVGDVIQVLQNDGKGNFTAQNPIVLNRRDIAAATFGDVNKDGIPDLVMVLTPSTGQYGSNPYVFDHVSQLSVWTWVADGHGGFTPTTQAPIPLAGTDQNAPSSITLADLDGDGNPDLVLGNNTSGEVRLAINDGTGTMRPPTTSLPSVGSYGAVNFVQRQVFADFNNDGRMDFATTSPNGVDVYLAQADGSFRHTASLAGINFVTAGDVNNDGIPDLVVGGANRVNQYGAAYVDSRSGTVYLGNGDGTFRQGATFSTASYVIDSVTLADFNHDGNLDAIATLHQPDMYPPYFVGVLFGDGKGDLSFNANTLLTALFSDYDLSGSLTPVIGDFNNDGNLDMVIATQNPSTGATELVDYLGAGNGTFTPGPILDNNDYLQGVVGDLNGDGKPDLVILHSDLTATVYLGDGQGGFSKGSTLDLSMGSSYYGPLPPGDIVLEDFNGDGNLDLAVSDYHSNVVDIYPGDGTGNFGAPQAVTVGDGPDTLVSVPLTPFLDVGTFTIPDHSPIAADDQATVLSGQAVTIAVLANDSHLDHAPLTVMQVSTPAHGVAHITDGGTTVTYAPAANFQGTDTFTYTSADPAGMTATATVTVTVHSITIAPATLPDGQIQSKYKQQLSAGGGTAPYTFAVTAGALPQGLTLSSAGLLSGTPTAIDTESFTITVTDQSNLSVATPFTLAIDPLPMPTITVSTNTLDLGTTITGTPGAPQSYTVSGTNLTGSITVTAPAGVQLSSDNGATFHGSLTLTPSSGTVATTTIDVRISAAATVGAISNNISDASSGAMTQNVTVSGTVNPVPTPTITVSTSTLNLGTTIKAIPGTAQSYIISGSGLTAPITITAPGGVELSSNNGASFHASLTLHPSSGTVADTIIEVRLKASTSVGAIHSARIINKSTGAAGQGVSVSGTVAPAPALTVRPTFLALGAAVAGTPGRLKTYTISGRNLVGNVVITAPSGVELSSDGGKSFSATLTLTPTADRLATTTIAVRIAASAAVGTIKARITDTTTAGAEKNVSVSGIVRAAPSLTLNVSALNLSTTTAGTAGPVISYTISGSNLRTVVNITAPPDVELSSDGAKTFHASLKLTPSGSTLTRRTIAVRIRASATAGTITNALITNISTGAAEKDVSVSGTIDP